MPSSVPDAHVDALFATGQVARYRCVFDMDWTGDFAGEAIAAITGHAPSEFAAGGGRTWSSIVYPEDRAFLLSVAREAVASREPFAIRYRVVHASGEVREVAERGTAVFGEDGEFSHFEGEIVALEPH